LFIIAYTSIFIFFKIGPILVRGLAEIVERRPNDPIEYLATFLYKQVENTRVQKQVIFDLNFFFQFDFVCLM
jgi:hypothetical protein